MSAILLALTLVCTNPPISDGDTLHCPDQRVRLFGINAPEMHPLELGAAEAKARLYQLTRTTITCRPAGNQHDRYGRLVGRCWTGDGVDVGAEMAREGLACVWRRYAGREYRGVGRDCDGSGK